jgi:hypothetical protein
MESSIKGFKPNMGFTKILTVSAGAGGGSTGLGLQAKSVIRNKAIQITFILRVKKRFL